MMRWYKYLTSLFFEKSPPVLAPGGDFCTFSPSVLALIFNLPGIDQCYNPKVFMEKSYT